MNQDLDIVYQFTSINLNELDKLNFINRFDRKYIFHQDLLMNLLKSMLNNYKILDINNKRIFHYRNYYYDTKDFKFFLDHHNDYKNRFKIRIRNYFDLNETFLEIKTKNNKSLTEKIRLKINNNHFQINKYASVLENYINLSTNILQNTINVYYDRMTFVSNSYDEKITLDINLSFENNGIYKGFNNLIVAEIKTSSRTHNSKIKSEFSKLGIHSIGFSKYEIGCIELYENLKYNRFKENLIKINKIG